MNMSLSRPTPVIKDTALSEELGCEVFLKLEIYNPTGSHKDRESLKIIAECKTKGILEVGCASTGNFGISLAYYAKISGIKCHVWFSKKGFDPARLAFLNAFGAQIHPLDLDLNDLYVTSSQRMRDEKIYDANPGKCPAKIEANAEIGREITSQVKGLDTVICCVNNGSHLLGLAQGLKGSGVRLIAAYSHSELASSIKGFHQAEGQEKIRTALSVLRGSLIEVNDEDLRFGVTSLLKAGIVAEVSSASVVGALKKIGSLDNQRLCCIITGYGLKYPQELGRLLYP